MQLKTDFDSSLTCYNLDPKSTRFPSIILKFFLAKLYLLMDFRIKFDHQFLWIVFTEKETLNFIEA
jgi:hypothetical protein